MNRSTIKSKVERVAIRTYKQVQSPSSYRDYGHNEYFNKMCNNLHLEGISFEREKKIGERKPDIYVDGFGAIEVKAKRSGLTQDDIKQAEYIAKISGYPCMVINFGTQNGPHIREFAPL